MDCKMKKTTGHISFEIYTHCPHCCRGMNLICIEDNYEGWITRIFRNWINNKPEADKPNFIVTCPKCYKEFMVEKLEY